MPYYRERFARAGVRAGDVRDLSDLSRLPITTKSDLRAEVSRRHHRGEHSRASPAADDDLGLDGVAVSVLLGSRGRESGCAGPISSRSSWAGAAVWDTRVVIASPAYFYNQIAAAPRWRQVAGRLVLGEQSVSLSADVLTTASFRALVSRVARRGGYFIRGYPGLDRQALPPGSWRRAPRWPAYPKVVVAFAETLTPADAAAIQRALRCRVVNYYSSWEVPQMAQTLPRSPGAPPRQRRPRDPPRGAGRRNATRRRESPGAWCVTDLENYVMPFINYDNGDRAVAGTACRCGRGLPVLASLEGRDSEVVRNPGGREFSGVVLGQFLAFVVGVIPYVWEYQAVQSAPDAISLRVVPTARFDPPFAEKLRAELETFLGPGVKVAVEPVEHIPLEPSGKRLIIKRGQQSEKDCPASALQSRRD